MLKNYFLSAIRNIRKNIFYAVINIIGLALALAICITAFLNNKWNWDFNKGQENYNDIYKVNITKKVKEREQEYAVCPMPVGNKIANDIPQVNKVVNIFHTQLPIKREQKIFNQMIGCTDENFTEVFTLNMLSGNKESLSERNKILINRSTAKKYFGNLEVTGEFLSLIDDNGEEHTFIIGGVFEDFPDNSSFYFDAFINKEVYLDMRGIKEGNWNHWYSSTFLYIKNENNVDEVERLLQDYIPIQNEAREDWKINRFKVEPLATIHKTIRDRWSTSLRYGLHPSQAKSPPLMALFILIIACFNFVNTAIAFAGKRLKEISIRKVYGGSRRQIIHQFLLENFILSLISILGGVFLSRFILSAYSKMWYYMELELTFQNNPELILFLGGLLIVTTLLAGAYPAFYISSFKPVKIFREKLKLGERNAISKILLTVQLMISVIALSSGIIFTQNSKYQRELDYGYKKDKIILLDFDNKDNYEPIEQVVKSNPKIKLYGGTDHHIGYSNYSRKIKYKQNEQEIDVMDVGVNYLQTMGLQLKQGRMFDPKFESSDISENSVIINEKLANDMNWHDPVGKIAYLNDTTKIRVIGLVNNFYLYGTWAPVEPLAIKLAPREEYDLMALQVNQNEMNEVNQYLKNQWGEIIPNHPYGGRFQEDLFQEARTVNKHIKEINIFLAIVASLLSAVGLFALVSLRIISKTKEIGIRKVVGASVPIVMRVISRPYIKIVGIAVALGLIAGYYMNNMLLNSLWSQHVTPNFISFFLPVLLIVLVSAITVANKIYSAANQNPARSLRYE
jgi:ABC-type antimicrobial peptide transport system permease subunit